MSRNSARYANATKKCRPSNKEETDLATMGEKERHRGWLYARRSVTQARWATAPSPGGDPPNGGGRDTQSRLASLRRKPEMIVVLARTGGKTCAYSLPSHPRDCANPFGASVTSGFYPRFPIVRRSFANITVLWHFSSYARQVEYATVILLRAKKVPEKLCAY